MNRIAINEPCHENWAAMTPTQQGAFCGKCQIDVIDFSGKSAEEVKRILQENAGKHLCGRFKKTQLDDVNEAYLEWDNQSVKIFQSKFMYACLLVFGMTLFSCESDEEKIIGQISMEQLDTHDQLETTNTNEYASAGNPTDTNGDNRTYLQDEPGYLKGKVAYNYTEEPTNCTPVKDTLETEYIKGEIALEPEPPIRMGLVEWVPGPEVDSTRQTDNTGTIKTPEEFTGKIYPNPAGTVANLELQIKQTAYYTIDLLNMDGQLVMRIFYGELTPGIVNHAIDLTRCKDGTYLIEVNANGQREVYPYVKIAE